MIGDRAELLNLLQGLAPRDGMHALRVPGVFAIRRSSISAQQLHGVQQSAFCLVAQGAKSLWIGAEKYDYDTNTMILFSVDVPVASRVTLASPDEPFLCLRLDLDPARVAELVLRVFPKGLKTNLDRLAVSMTPTDPQVVDAAVRLLRLASHADDAELLAPLVVEEILIRLLRGPVGPKLAPIGLADSGVQGVAKAVSWLRENFEQAIRVENLADRAAMSPSSFHQHFKEVTSMSPLQYQKVLRLQEARRLMLTLTLDAASASRRVGYASASQFTREYGRFFGDAPVRDLARIREQALSSGQGD